MGTEGIGIGIGIPGTGRPVPHTWGIALAVQNWPVGTRLSYIDVLGETIDVARHRVVEEALKVDNVKYLWFLDDDVVPPKQAANALMYLLDNHGPQVGGKVMVAGGIYCAKHVPPTPNVFMAPSEGPWWRWKVGDVFRCWGIATGCMMVNMKVFDYLEPPYFRTISTDEEKCTDDLYFCDLVNKAGFHILAHGGVICTHWDVSKIPNLIYGLPATSFPMKPRKAGKTVHSFDYPVRYRERNTTESCLEGEVVCP